MVSSCLSTWWCFQTEGWGGVLLAVGRGRGFQDKQTSSHVGKCSSDCRQNSFTTERKGSFITEAGTETQVGKEKGRESVQCQNLSEKLSISWQAPPKHLLPYLLGETWWSKTSSLQHTCQGVFLFLFMDVQRHQNSVLF